MFDRAYCLRRVSALKAGRTSFEPQWRDVEEYVLPGSTEFTTSETNRGDRKNKQVLNDTATDASRTLSSGMMGGLTSPARPWLGADEQSRPEPKEERGCVARYRNQEHGRRLSAVEHLSGAAPVLR